MAEDLSVKKISYANWNVIYGRSSYGRYFTLRLPWGASGA